MAGVDPRTTLPITIDVGTNNEEALADPLYVGLRHKRETGARYDALIDEFVAGVIEVFGRDCLVRVALDCSQMGPFFLLLLFFFSLISCVVM